MRIAIGETANYRMPGSLARLSALGARDGAVTERKGGRRVTPLSGPDTCLRLSSPKLKVLAEAKCTYVRVRVRPPSPPGTCLSRPRSATSISPEPSPTPSADSIAAVVATADGVEDVERTCV